MPRRRRRQTSLLDNTVINRIHDASSHGKRSRVDSGGTVYVQIVIMRKQTDKEREFWRLVELTKYHGTMCPCDACKKVRAA